MTTVYRILKYTSINLSFFSLKWFHLSILYILYSTIFQGETEKEVELVEGPGGGGEGLQKEGGKEGWMGRVKW